MRGQVTAKRVVESPVKSVADWRKETTRQSLRGNRKLGGIEPIYLHIGSVMCEMRERLQITQTELGEAIGVTRAQIANIEGGKSRVMVHQTSNHRQQAADTAERVLHGGQMITRTLLRIGLVKRVDGRIVWPVHVEPRQWWLVQWREMVRTRSLRRGSFAAVGVFRNLPGVIKWIPGRLLPRRWGFYVFGLEIGDRGCNWDEVK